MANRPLIAILRGVTTAEALDKFTDAL